MSGRFVRASKYRHVFGQPTKREQCYDNLRVSRNAWDTNLIKANGSYLAVNWEAGGGGAFAVLPLHEKGKLPDQLPLFRGHTAVVLDTDWSPFDDRLLASASDDGKVFLWQVPEDFTIHSEVPEEIEDVAPIGKLSGHARKVGHVLFNPAAENILASASGDYSVKIWDLEDGKAKLTLQGSDIFTSLAWSADGSTLVTTSRDKKLRFWDVRQQRPAYEGPGHGGAKNSRCVWLGEHDRVVTTGFSKMSERQIGLWDQRNPTEPLGGFMPLDSGSGVGMPFWDDGCQILYIAGKGDGNIRYYEYAHDKFEFLSEYRSAQPQRGLAFLPKRAVNTHENEVMRAFKTVDDAYIEPISFIVPRRAESFQEDIYPPTAGTKPAVSSAEWLAGKTALPMKLSMQDVYEGNDDPTLIAAKEVSRPAPAAAAPAPASPAKPTPAPAPEPTPAPVSRSIPSVNSNKQSMSAAAARFADGDDEDDHDAGPDDFSEPPKPASRAATQPSSAAPAATSTQPFRPTPAAAPAAESREVPSAAAAATAAPTSSKAEEESKPAPSASAAAGGLRDVLNEIRGMLQSQGKEIVALREEIAALKQKVGE